MTNRLYVLVAACALALSPALAQKQQSIQTIQDLNEPGRNPYQSTLEVTAANCLIWNICSVAFPAVPAGKRLVIEHAAARVNISSGDAVLVLLGTAPSSAIPLVPTVRYDTSLRFAASVPVTYYFEAGEIPAVHVTFASGALYSGIPSYVTLVGHLVAVP